MTVKIGKAWEEENKDEDHSNNNDDDDDDEPSYWKVYQGGTSCLVQPEARRRGWRGMGGRECDKGVKERERERERE